MFLFKIFEKQSYNINKKVRRDLSWSTYFSGREVMHYILSNFLVFEFLKLNWRSVVKTTEPRDDSGICMIKKTQKLLMGN